MQNKCENPECELRTFYPGLCYRCRTLSDNPNTITTIKSIAEKTLSKTREEAQRDYEYWNTRWVSGENTEEVRYNRLQNFAILNKIKTDSE